MFVTKEEHEGYRIIQFIHLFEVWDLIEIAYIENGKIFYPVGDTFFKSRSWSQSR